jgi:hypothetical protein
MARGVRHMSMGILERRRIEANIIKPIYEEMVANFGKAAAQKVLGAAIRKAAIQQGREMAAAQGGELGLKGFVALRELWTRGGALETREIAASEAGYDYDVTRCRYAEMYREMGLGDIGHLLSCNRDGTFCQGYDPRIKLTRTQTIMEGASHCDFRYRFEPEAKS